MSRVVVHAELTLEEANLVVEALEAFKAAALEDGNTADLTADRKDADRRYQGADNLIRILRFG